jgi:DNA mismatch repair ATPase MutS
MDELFTGTSAEKGEKAAQKFSEAIFPRANILVMFATHFAKVTEIASSPSMHGVAKNFKIEAVRMEDGSVHRPFKLEVGVSEVNVADDILNKEMGDDIDFD